MVRQFAQHHNKIQFFGYEVANLVLVFQYMLQSGTTGYGFNWETCAALAFLGGSAMIWLFDPQTRPHLLFYGGLALTLGGFFLAVAGYGLTGAAVILASFETTRGGLLVLQAMVTAKQTEQERISPIRHFHLRLGYLLLGWYCRIVDRFAAQFPEIGRLINERPFVTGSLIKAPLRVEFVAKKLLVADWIGAAVGISWMLLGDLALAFNDPQLYTWATENGRTATPAHESTHESSRQPAITAASAD